MSEYFANNALHERATMLESERAEWAKKLAPAKPRTTKAKQKKINLFSRIFGVK